MPAQTPLIIEARINETAFRENWNDNVPYAPDEIVREAVRAWEAGASIVHFHGRNPQTGEPQNDVELYDAVYDGIRERTDLIVHPTLGYMSQSDPRERVKHIAHVAADAERRIEMAPVDFGSVNVDYWNPAKRDFETRDRVYVNSRGNLEAVLGAFKELGTFVSTVVWDTGQMRTAKCFQEMGLLARGTIWEFVFTGEIMPNGAPPTIPALLAMVDEVPAGEPWLVLCWNGDVLPVAAAAIVLGGHVAIGLGDWHYRRLGMPHNGELVAEVAQLARIVGRPVATPAQARELLGLPARARAAAHA